MQDRHLFEYAVIRLVPKVEREEFINVGVILYCKGLKFLLAKYKLDEQRLKALDPTCDAVEVDQHLQAFSEISKGSMHAGPIGTLDMPSRFRWLTATRSTVIQTSKVHPGFCTDASETLDKLFSVLVG